VRSILEQVRHDARVVDADVGQWVPLGFGGQGRTVMIDGRDASDEHNRRLGNISPITPGYFETMGIRVLRGRKLSEQDCSSSAARVAIIDETAAEQFWPNEDPIGRRFRFLVDNEPIEVVGVVRNSKALTLGETPVPMMYIPFIDLPDGGITLFVHTSGSPAPVLNDVHQIVRKIDMHIPILYEKTIHDHLALALWPSWMGALLLGSLGALALVLASMGVYGVMAYAVSQRTRELGIRMALGAQARQVLQLVLQQGMTLAIIGLVIGLVAAFALTHLVAALLYGVNPNDPAIFFGVTLVLAIAAFAACYLPARRAVKIDPIVALRFE
jgi:predicted permease